jgi:hypothetical protein
LALRYNTPFRSTSPPRKIPVYGQYGVVVLRDFFCVLPFTPVLAAGEGRPEAVDVAHPDIGDIIRDAFLSTLFTAIRSSSLW